jgi:hypothetical protein
MGVRKDGVTLVDDIGGGGAPVDATIVAPIGPNLAVDSVSVTLATDELPIIVDAIPTETTTIDTIDALNDFVEITVPKGHNSILAIFTPTGWNGTISFSLNGVVCSGLNISSSAWVSSFNTGVGVFSFPVTGGSVFRATCSLFTSGSEVFTGITSISESIKYPLGVGDTLTVHDSLAFAIQESIVADNMLFGDISSILSVGMMFDGTGWDRVRGSSVDGLLVNLGANNDVVVSATDLDIRNLLFATDKVDVSGSTVDTELPAAELLRENTANPTVPGVAAFGMVYDGATWDRLPGTDLGVTVKPANDTGGSAIAINVLNEFVRVLPPFGYNSVGVSISGSMVGTLELQYTFGEPGGKGMFDLQQNKWISQIVNPTFGDFYIIPISPSLSGTEVLLVCTAYFSGSATVALIPSLTHVVGNPLTNVELRETPLVVNTKTDLSPSAPTVASVGVASAQAVAAAATRKGLILRNLSNARISLGFGSAAVLDNGVTLYPRDTFEMDEYDFDLAAVNAIASAAASSLSIQEYLV